MTYIPPKGIASHPAVEACEHEDDTDYRHSVWLKAGWVFGSGRDEGCRGSRFQSVADFRAVRIVQVQS
jgi:hypothetical protein